MVIVHEHEGIMAAYEFIRRQEIETNYRYASYSCSKNFGNTPLTTMKRVFWQDNNSVKVARQEFTGVPFGVLGRKNLDCCFGKDRKKKAKEKTAARALESYYGPDAKVRKVIESKKINCAAGCYMREICRFPQFRVELDAPAVQKKHQEREILSRIQSGDTLEFERIIVTSIPDPSDHTCHAAADIPHQPIDRRLTERIRDLCAAGVTSLDAVRTQLYFYVRDLCDPLPDPTNTRFYPSNKIISNHIYRYTEKGKLFKNQQTGEGLTPERKVVGKRSRKGSTKSPSSANRLKRTFNEMERAVQPILPIRPIQGSPMTTHILRLGPGEEIVTSLKNYVKDNRLEAAYIITCVGSVSYATLRMADSVTINTYGGDGAFEIISLVGTLSGGGHLHGCFSDAEGRVVGGHVMGNLIVYTTAEIVIGNSGHYKLTRELDERTGYNELVVSKK